MPPPRATSRGSRWTAALAELLASLGPGLARVTTFKGTAVTKEACSRHWDRIENTDLVILGAALFLEPTTTSPQGGRLVGVDVLTP